MSFINTPLGFYANLYRGTPFLMATRKCSVFFFILLLLAIEVPAYTAARNRKNEYATHELNAMILSEYKPKLRRKYIFQLSTYDALSKLRIVNFIDELPPERKGSSHRLTEIESSLRVRPGSVYLWRDFPRRIAFCVKARLFYCRFYRSCLVNSMWRCLC